MKDGPERVCKIASLGRGTRRLVWLSSAVKHQTLPRALAMLIWPSRDWILFSNYKVAFPSAGARRQVQVQTGVTVLLSHLNMVLNSVLHICRNSCLGKANTRSPFPGRQRFPSTHSVGPESSADLSEEVWKSAQRKLLLTAPCLADGQPAQSGPFTG